MRTAALALVLLLGAPPVGATTTVFLDRCAAGCTYTPGVEDSRINQSSIISSQSSLAASTLGDESWNAVVACVRDVFAPFDVVVTDVDPGDAPHLEVGVAGTPQNLGLPAGIQNVAPAQCAFVPNAIGFAFAGQIGDDPPAICWSAAQALGSAMAGLDHEVLAGDVMSTIPGPSPKQFLDETASCGESTPRDCFCGGTTQNSYQQLLAVLPEPDTAAAGCAALFTLAARLRRRRGLDSIR
jgi:hypothetical protein